MTRVKIGLGMLAIMLVWVSLVSMMASDKGCTRDGWPRCIDADVGGIGQ